MLTPAERKEITRDLKLAAGLLENRGHRRLASAVARHAVTIETLVLLDPCPPDDIDSRTVNIRIAN